MALGARAPFLLPTYASVSLFQGKPSVTAGRKAKGSRDPRQPGCRRSAPAPRPDQSAGPSFGPPSNGSSRSHRVLGRTMSSRRSPPRGNSGGFAFDVGADSTAMLAPVLYENLVGIEPGGQHPGDVRARRVRLHGVGGVPGHTARLVHDDAYRAQQRKVGGV